VSCNQRARIRRTVRLRPKGTNYFKGVVPAGLLVYIVNEKPAGAIPNYVDVWVASDQIYKQGTAPPGARLRISAEHLERLP
jgi:hypothetical protein